MGLDVSLYHYKNLIKAEREEEEYRNKSDDIWSEIQQGGDYKHLTKEEKSLADEKCEQLSLEMGLGKFGEYPDGRSISLDSKLYPEHMFKIGYIRSSYNSAGIDSVLNRMGIHDLYYIFPHEDNYRFIPTWEDSLKRAKVVLNLFKSRMNEDIGKYDVSFVHSLPNQTGAGSEIETLKLFQEELDKYRKGKDGIDPSVVFDDYSSHKGEFYLGKGLVVHGIIYGSRYSFESNGMYIVYEKDKESLLWYLHALEIVVETIEYVINNPVEVGDYVLHWSG